jgi:Mg-chelatase subunit ChlD
MFRISNYWALGLLILIPYTFYITKKSLADISSWRKWSTFALRSLIIILLVLSLAGFKLVWKIDRLCVIFVLDTSSSIPESEVQRSLDFARKASESLKETDQAGLISFSKGARIEIPPKESANITRISPQLSGEYTDLESAIEVAMDLFPVASQKRLVIMSDGNENAGNATDILAIARSNDIEIYTLPLDTKGKGTNEVFIDGLVGPGNVMQGRSFELRAIIQSTMDGTAKLKLFKDRDYLDEKEIELSASRRQVFTFLQTLEVEGTHVYEVLIEPSFDTMRENNRARTLVIATGQPKVLYATNEQNRLDYIEEILTRKDIILKTIHDPALIPTSLSELQNYSTIVFNDLPVDNLSKPQMEMIKSYVHDLGGGFVMIGGVNSFGGGGYYNTPIEEILPVKMIPERKKGSLAIVLAIDRSGSMAASAGRYTKIDLAKEAAVSVVDFLNEKDEIGIVAFDAEAQEIVSLEKVKSKVEIEDKIATIRPGGGTNIYPALKVAYGWLRNSDAKLKHIILVSDGKSDQPNESYTLVSQIAGDKITVSTVAIGRDADGRTMRDIADPGLGRYYETDDAGSLPRIFIKEAFVASKLIMEGSFKPVIYGESEILKGIDTDNLPKLRGYVGTSSKEGASVLITSGSGDLLSQDDPILVTWQHGLGRTLAFTSDTKPKWASEWLKWDNFGKFWSQAIGWTLAVPSGEFDASASILGNKGKVTVDAVDSKGRLRNFLNFQADLVKPELTHEKISMVQKAPGRYEAEFDASQIGTYLLRVNEIRDGEVINAQNTGAVTSYSPEYKNLESNHSLLKAIAADTDGKFNPEPHEVTIHGEKAVWQLQDLWQTLVIASIPLFFLDIILRRVTIFREQLLELKNRFRQTREEETPGIDTGTLLNLKQRREEIRVGGKKLDLSQRADDSSISRRVLDSENTRPSVPTDQTESEGDYTSRLLKAKKRVDQKQDR